MSEILKVNDVSFKYPAETELALKNVTLSCMKGEWLSVTGHNGSGKSTLAKLLNGLLLPDSGNVEVEGLFTTNMDELWEIRRRVGVVFQNPDNQFVGTSVRDDIAFGLENFGVPRDEMIRRIDESVKHVGMEQYLDQEPHLLSGGQKQRVAIAGILAQAPSIIILDEATSMLDPMGRKEVLETVRTLNKEKGITVISITHDLEEALHSDRVLVMNKGRVSALGAPSDIFSNTSLILDAGLDTPFSVKLSQKLREEGVPLTRDYLTQEELVKALWTLKSGS
ncbi:energy-coupling factor ABC transporter ATP-binding protein [Fictibacillus aquaticus]|uniref:Energy-coupling factor transporter ATPase n=1 Tax=Fictibacillus aquaticus TaxID=2021314 RepID=A0A235F7L8_9BACL|nr:energy-coupling factor transporter ATPase [Fictibacillus aquaticus]